MDALRPTCANEAAVQVVRMLGTAQSGKRPRAKKVIAYLCDLGTEEESRSEMPGPTLVGLRDCSLEPAEEEFHFALRPPNPF